MANQVNAAVAAQVEIPSGGGAGTGEIVQSRPNPDGSTTYYALTAKHVLAGKSSGSYATEPGSTQMIPIPKYVVTQTGAFPIDSMYRDPSGKDLALFSFTVPSGGEPLAVSKVSPNGAADLAAKPITLVGGAPDGSREELRVEGADVKRNGVFWSYTSPVPPAVPIGPEDPDHAELPPGVWSVPSNLVPTEPGASGSGYVGPGGIAGVHRGVSSRRDGGPDKGRTHLTPVDKAWVSSGVEALERGDGPDVRRLNPTPTQREQIETYYRRYELPLRLDGN